MAVTVSGKDISRPKSTDSVFYLYDDDLTAARWETSEPVPPFTGAVGRIGVVHYEPERDRRLKHISRMGYGLFPDLRGKGLGVAAASACIARGFRDYRTLWVKLPGDQGYDAAYHVLSSLGFERYEHPKLDAAQLEWLDARVRVIALTKQHDDIGIRAPSIRMPSGISAPKKP